MRLVIISDSHNQLAKMEIPEGDILVHAGDMTGRGTVAEISQFNHELGNIKHKFKHIVAIAGNHDWLFEENQGLARSIIYNVDHYLHHEEKEVEGLRFFGSPYTPEFCNWAFNVARSKLGFKWNQIPSKGIDILVTHGPPYGILDQVPPWEQNVGDGELLDAVLRVKPKLHIFGHVHHSYGVKDFEGITFINASSCDERYMPFNSPVVIDL